MKLITKLMVALCLLAFLSFDASATDPYDHEHGAPTSLVVPAKAAFFWPR